MELVMTLTHWHWLTLGLLLFAAETLGTGGFLLGVAVASVATSVCAWLGLSWQVQVIAFAVMSITFSFAYWRYFKDFNLKREKGDIVINEKSESLKGKSGKVLNSEDEYHGKLSIGDTLWEYKSESPVKVGDSVVVKSAEGMLLYVVPRT
ncbi:MAG: NfeD family protein [Agarilytica sp.]